MRTREKKDYLHFHWRQSRRTFHPRRSLFRHMDDMVGASSSLSLYLSHTHIQVHTHSHTHTWTHSLAHTYTHKHTQAHTHTHSLTYTFSHIHTWTVRWTHALLVKDLLLKLLRLLLRWEREKRKERKLCVREREREAIKVKIPIVSLLEASVRLDPRSTLLLSYKEWLFFSRQEQVFWFLHTLLTDRTFSFCDIKISFWNVC